MPLRAILDQRDVIGPDLDRAAWEALKERRTELRMPCCSAAAIMRVSKLGLHHFAHKTRQPGDVVCDWKPESEEHLRTKLEILSACRAAGWHAQPEARAEDGSWRADVLAWRDTDRGTTRVAFEVQLSVQSRSETERRQARYADAGIRGCWFVRPRRSTAKFPDRNEHFLDPSASLPAFRVVVDEPSIRVAIPTGYDEETDVVEPIGTFVMALLTRRVRFATHTTNNVARRVRAVFVPTACWRCGADSHYYYLDPLFLGREHSSSSTAPRAACGRLLRSNWDSEALSPDVVAAVVARVRDEPSLRVHLGPIKQRFSKAGGRRYLSFGCPKCDALFGEHFLFDEVSDYAQNGAPPSFPTLEVDLPASGRRSWDPHWCYPNEGPFCEALAGDTNSGDEE